MNRGASRIDGDLFQQEIRQQGATWSVSHVTNSQASVTENSGEDGLAAAISVLAFCKFCLNCGIMVGVG